MRPIAARNTTANANWKRWSDQRIAADRLGALARAYRRGDRTADSMTSYERAEVCAWLVNHPRPKGERR